jgi:AraC-like DNA-binding protein
MTPETFSTLSLRPREQFDGWRSWYRAIFDVLPKEQDSGSFPAEIRMWKLGGMAMSRTDAPPVNVVRTKHHLRREPIDHWIISYCARGAHSAVTAGSSLEVPARVPFLWSLGQEFVHERTHVERIQFFLARDAFGDIGPVLDAALGTALDTPLGHLLGEYMLALEQRLPMVAEPDLPRLATAVGAMVAAAVAPSAERVAVARPQIDVGRMEKVRRTVQRHLRTPTLRPATLWRLVGMSRSNLYRLFDDSGGVARYIQRQRLLAAHEMLADPDNPLSISAIAEEFCFADASAFSRAYRREFGRTPSDTRGAAQSELTPDGMPGRASAVSSPPSDFGGLLRHF